MNLPAAFVSQMTALLPQHELAAFLDAISSEPITSLRLNPHKSSISLSSYEPVAWCRHACYLPQRPIFTGDPLFHAGAYYVQEASSMFVDEVVRQLIGERDIVALDLCAAPGGKSTLLRSALSEGSLLVSNEVVRNRAQILAENMVKWGHEQSVVISNATRDFRSLPPCFDLILADVPCSGEGMFRKDATAIDEWSVQNVNQCQERQQGIIADVWGSLNEGGYLIYSTCTYNTKENEENVDWICKELGGELVSIEVSPEWHIHETLCPDVRPVYRFMPHFTRGEGLFLAVIRKCSEENYVSSARKKKEKQRKGQRDPQIPAELKTWITRSDMELKVVGDTVITIPAAFVPYYERFSEHFHFLKPFLTVAELKGRDWVPHHELAMSHIFNREAFPQVDLDGETALAYLRKDAIVLPESTPRGYVSVCFGETPLGWVKHLGNRSNNLYPQEWRIRNTGIKFWGSVI